MISFFIIVLISSALWIGSIHVDMPQRYILIWLAIPLDMFGHIPATIVMRRSQRKNEGWINKHLAKYFEFYPGTYIPPSLLSLC
jgi:low temperature requirement protein LtrA